MAGPVPPQREWDVRALRRGVWPTGLDNYYVIERLFDAPIETTARGATGPVLEVACGDAAHLCRLNRLGLRAYGLEPSPPMLVRAHERTAEFGATVTLVRGFAERLPFRDRLFDRVLCESALDHFAQPDLAMAEMARVVRRDGRVIVGLVNYGGLTARVSRALYLVGRRLGWVARDRQLFWDTPVPHEHTFEGTYSVLLALGRRHLELEHAYGVSIGWGFPGWGRLLSPLSTDRQMFIIRKLDRIALRLPRVADYVFSVWRLPGSAD